MRLIKMKEALIEKLKIYVFPLFGFAVLLIGIAAGYVLVQMEQKLQTKASTSNASINLPLMKSVFVGSEFDVPIIIKNDNQEIIGADIVLTFDKNIIQLKDIVPNSNNPLNYFLPLDTNGAFNKAKMIQDGNTNGKLFFSALCYSNGPCTKGLDADLTEANPLATLRFRALATGDTVLNLSFAPEDSTTDSNLQSKAGQDVLGRVTNLSLNIALVPPAPTSTINPTTTSQPSPTPSVVGGLAVYDDAFVNNFKANADSSTLITTTRSDIKSSGSSSMELNLFAYRTPFFVMNQSKLNSSDYNYLEFDAYFLNGPKGPVPHLYVNIAKSPYWDLSWTTVAVAGSGSDVLITPNSGWKHIKVPLSSFGVPANTPFAGLSIHDREPWYGNDPNADLWGHVLIDNIKFTK